MLPYLTHDGEEVSVGSAEHAYDVYGQAVGFKNFQDDPMPAFGDLPEPIRGAWRAVATKLFAAGVFARKEEADAALPKPYVHVFDANRLLAARLCHAANQALQRVTGEDVNPDWEDLSADLKRSTLDGVQFAWDNPDATPADQHEAWAAERSFQGWTYGNVKDAEFKTHPCLVPYDELPEIQRAKDGVFRAIALTLRPSTEPSRPDVPDPGANPLL